MFPIKRLYDLQELDLAIDAREKALAEVRLRIADDSAVTMARNSVTELDIELQGPSTQRRTLEFAVQKLTDKISSVENKLYGGAITNPRELSAYEADSAQLHGQRSAEEDKLLEIMVEVDEVRSERDHAIQAFERIKAERQSDILKLEKEDHQLGAELKELHQSRDQVTPGLPASAISTYEMLRETRDGVAVARLVRSMCEKCRLTMPTMELQRAKTSQDIVQCSNCHRILFPT